MALNFRPISINDKKLVESYTQASGKLNCDTSFANIFCYAQNWHTEICEIDSFLILRFKIDSGNKIGYSELFGDGNIEDVLELVFNDAKSLNQPLRLFNLSKEFADKIQSSKYKDQIYLYTDRNFSDYIYSREALCTLSGKHLQPKRNHVNKFKNSYTYTTLPLTPNHSDEIMDLVIRWQNTKETHHDSILFEQSIIRCALQNFTAFDMRGLILYVDNKIVAFTFGAPINDSTFDVMFEKADTNYDGAFTMINKMFVSSLPEQFTLINREEDLGIPGLRKSKLSYNPQTLYEKWYAISSESICYDIMKLWQNVFGDEPSFILYYLLHYSSEKNRIVHYEDGKLVGMIYFHTFSNGVCNVEYLYALGVHSEYRKRGIAHKILEEALEKSRQDGAQYAVLIPSSNELREWYKKEFGFLDMNTNSLNFQTPDDFDFGSGNAEQDLGLYKPITSELDIPSPCSQTKLIFVK